MRALLAAGLAGAWLLSALWACGPLLVPAVPEVGAGLADCLRFVGLGVLALLGGMGLAHVRSARAVPAAPRWELPAGDVIEMERWDA